MGLLDSLFEPYQQGGGLLDFLRSSQMQQQNYQPSAGFPDQQPQATFAQRFDQSQPPASFGDRFGLATPQAVGDYQMPRLGSAQAFTPDPAALPQNAQPAQGQLPQAPQQQAPQAMQVAPQAPTAQPSFLQNTSPSGFSGAFRGMAANAHTGPLGMLMAGVGGAMGMGQGSPQDIQRQNMTAQYQSIRQSLIENGETAQAAASKAMVAVMNPEAAKTILPELFTSKQKYGVISENPIEGKKYGFVNERDQTINGKPMGSEASGQNSTGLLATGVTSYNPNLSGNEYLAQFSPEVQAAVKSYIAGDVMPSGNPRQQGIAAQAKTIAQKYGADTGIPVSDALYGEKRKYRTELGTNSTNSAGGQAKAFNQGISHLTALADNLEKLDNSNGMGIPAVAGVVNSARQGFSNEQSAISDEAKSLGQTVAGEVGKLFSGSAGGGVHERELTRERFNTVKSKPQLAAALRATLETMDGGLKALEQRRDSVLGPNSGVELVSEATKANIAKIQSAIDRLEGKSSAAPAAAGGIPSGWSVKVR